MSPTLFRLLLMNVQRLRVVNHFTKISKSIPTDYELLLRSLGTMLNYSTLLKRFNTCAKSENFVPQRFINNTIC